MNDSYWDRVRRLLDEGHRFAGLYATEAGATVRAVFIGVDGGTHLETVGREHGSVASIVDLVPAAGWDEREAHDLYGIGFDGHHPMRPLVDHDPRLDHWTVAVRGPDAYQVAVGPTHAGIIESGHFRFHVVGDRILHLDARLFYKHRGLERAAEGHNLADAAKHVARACAACSVANAVAYAAACEAALGFRPTAELRRVRTILLELERIWNHLNDIAAVCAGVGMAAGNQGFASLTERVRRTNAALTGHRFLAGTVGVGSATLRWDAEAMRRLRGELVSVRSDATLMWRDLSFNASFGDRLPDVGVIDVEQVGRLGVVGPAARAAGVTEDARTYAGGLAYDGFAVVVAEEPTGDVRARFEQRALELWQSFDLLDHLTERPVEPSSADADTDPKPIGVGVVESPRGRTVCAVEQDAGQIRRLHLRTGSYANWPAVAHAAAGNLLPDFPLINKSFELCYACADR